jgi:IclR family acetate operon transcriptional repressor
MAEAKQERRAARALPGVSPMGRWLFVLNAYAQQEEWGVRELAEETGVPRSAVSRIVREMERHGLLEQGVARGRYRVAPGLIRLASTIGGRYSVVRIARPVLETVVERCGETALLTLYSHKRRQSIPAEVVETSHPLRYIWSQMRDWEDVHLGASGKAILAFLPQEEQEAILASLNEPVGLLHPISKAEFRAQLEVACRQGFVVDRGERHDGVMVAAAPIWDRTNQVIGALLIYWPETRNRPGRSEEFGHLAKWAADEISVSLGFMPSTRPVTADRALS